MINTDNTGRCQMLTQHTSSSETVFTHHQTGIWQCEVSK